MAKIKLEDLLELRRGAIGKQSLACFLDDIKPHDAEVTDVFAHQPRNIIIPHQQQVDGHIFAIEEQLVLALREFEPTTLQQID